MQKPAIVTMDNTAQQKEMSDIDIRGIISYLNDLLEDMFGEPLDSDKLFGLVYSQGVLSCTNEPSAEFLLPEHDSTVISEEYVISHLWLSQTGTLYADLQHITNEALVKLVRIN